MQIVIWGAEEELELSSGKKHYSLQGIKFPNLKLRSKSELWVNLFKVDSAGMVIQRSQHMK
jgi:hypothetical protein